MRSHIYRERSKYQFYFLSIPVACSFVQPNLLQLALPTTCTPHTLVLRTGHTVICCILYTIYLYILLLSILLYNSYKIYYMYKLHQLATQLYMYLQLLRFFLLLLAISNSISSILYSMAVASRYQYQYWLATSSTSTYTYTQYIIAILSIIIYLYTNTNKLNTIQYTTHICTIQTTHTTKTSSQQLAMCVP